jgi:Flp pilus assembly protein TadG
MIYPKHTLCRRARRTRRGVSVPELAVVMPGVALLLLGVLDFAQIIYAYDTVSEAARAGARYAMVHGSRAGQNGLTAAGPAANDTNVANAVKANAPVLDHARLTITSSWGSGSNDPTCPVTVTTTYSYPPLLGGVLGLSVSVTGSTTMLITY